MIHQEKFNEKITDVNITVFPNYPHICFVIFCSHHLYSTAVQQELLLFTWHLKLLQDLLNDEYRIKTRIFISQQLARFCRNIFQKVKIKNF